MSWSFEFMGKKAAVIRELERYGAAKWVSENLGAANAIRHAIEMTQLCPDIVAQGTSYESKRGVYVKAQGHIDASSAAGTFEIKSVELYE